MSLMAYLSMARANDSLAFWTIACPEPYYARVEPYYARVPTISSILGAWGI